MANDINSIMSFGFSQIAGRLDGIEDMLWEMNERIRIIEQQIRFLYGEIKQVKNILFQGFNLVFEQLKNLQWSIDVGFLNLEAGLEYYNQKQLEHIEKYHELEFVARLKHAATLAMETQYLEPNSNVRVLRTENALNEAGKASALLWEYTNSKIVESTKELSKKSKNDFSIDKNVIQSLYLLRQNCFASNLVASLLSETSIPSARDHLYKKSQELSDLFKKFKLLDKMIPIDEIQQFAKIDGIEKFIGGGYSYILKRDFENLSKQTEELEVQLLPINSSPSIKIKAIKVDANQINLEISAGINRGNHKLFVSSVEPEELSKLKALPLPPGYKSNEYTKEYFHLLGGIEEDIDRISAYPLELEEAINLNMNIQEYKELLKVPYTKEGKLAFVNISKEENN